MLFMGAILNALLCFSLFVAPSAQANQVHHRVTTPKSVFAHFMVGNTYPYTVDDWTRDITLAQAKGIDAFALNVGRDEWQPGRVADAFTAAQNLYTQGIFFRLFLSFDMSSLPCLTGDDANTLRTYITTYQAHQNHFIYNGKPLVSTFAGESCLFGTGSLNDGWYSAIKPGNGFPAVHFVPAFFVDPNGFPSLTVIDGAFNWNSAWPMGDYDINVEPDQQYLNNLGRRTYMAGVSPWFFTHYGPDTYNKNFIYRGDDWLFAHRWELLVANRFSVDLVEAITWNDYGESHYIGPIDGAQPNSQAWVDGFDHEGWLDLMQFYITAYKTGQYPTIAKDRLFLWARLYPAATEAPDRVARPTNWQWTDDYLWAVALLSLPSDVTLTCGSSTSTTSVAAGVVKLKLPLNSTCSVNSTISRVGISVLDFAPPGFVFGEDPPNYNFNAFVAASE